MPRRPLDNEIAKARAAKAAADAKLAALLMEQARLVDEVVEEERLHDSHSERTLSDMQADSAQSQLGVRIAAGRAGQSASRKAQIAAGLRDEDVAELTGYNRSTVCKWHNGSMKVPEEARKLLAKRGIPAGSWSKR